MAHQRPEQNSNDSLLQNTRCCFCFPSFTSRGPAPAAALGLSWWQRIGSYSSRTHAAGDDNRHHRPWWDLGVRALKKIREWSEIAAGPRWKTFIRRFNRNRGYGAGGGSGNSRLGRFQYDPLSYALNFDEGQNGNFEEEYDDYSGSRDFSSRYASVPGSAEKTVAMDARSNNKDVAVMA